MVALARLRPPPDGSPPVIFPSNSLRIRTLPITSFACSGLRAFPLMPMKIRDLGDGGRWVPALL